MITQAQAIDLAVQGTYRGNGPVAKLCLSSGGLVRRHRRGVSDRLLLLGRRSAGPMRCCSRAWDQAIRGAGFAIPGALGVQEGGYLLLAPLAGCAQCGLGAVAGQARARIAAGACLACCTCTCQPGATADGSRVNGHGLK
jgi:hypothetical protein